MQQAPTMLPRVSSHTHTHIWTDKTWPFADGDERAPKASLDGEGRWDLFRKLVGYYMQCVRNEEGADACAFLNQLNSTFLFLRRTGFWQPRPGATWQVTIPLGQHLADFTARLSGAEDDTPLVLGYPINATFKEGADGINVSALRPVFFYPLQAEVVAQGLRLTIEDPVPEVNLGWLEYAFSRKPERQRNFLSACGFMRARMAEDGTPGRERAELAPGLDTLTAALSSFLPSRMRQRLDLADIPDTPLKEPFDNGIYNRAVIMFAKRTRFNKRLLQELSIISKAPDDVLDSTALAPLFAGQPSQVKSTTEGTSWKNSPVEGVAADVFPFNASQRQAVASLLRHDVSVITGPPGTGKSQVVAGTAANARFLDQSVLISSRNHKAIDAVVHRLTDASGQPMVLRTNSKEDPGLRVTFSTVIKAMLTSQTDPEAQERVQRAREDLFTRLEERGRESALAAEVLGISAELGQVENRLSYLQSELPDGLSPALDQFHQAFPTLLVRHASKFAQSGKASWSEFRFIILYLRLRNSLKPFPGTPTLPLWPDLQARTLLSDVMGTILKAAEYSELRARANELETRAAQLPPLEKLTERVARVGSRMESILQDLLTLDLKHRAGLRDEASRSKLAGLRAALNSIHTGLSDGRLDRQAAKEISNLGCEVLHAFPVWAVTNLSVGSRIPFCPGLFDLALIDEASQSDIPSAIPILFRARRVGVIGDPLQLTHTSRLSPAKDTLMRRSLGLEHLEEQRFAYTESSLYDLCAGVHMVRPIFLDTTYRSTEDIAGYSSQLFYNGGLRVGTDSGRLNPPQGVQPGIHWSEVDGEVKSSSGSGCHCPAEVEEIVRQVGELLRDGQFRGTLGIVTPFRQQANRIQDALFESGIDYQRLLGSQAHVDTAHGFQGDERDVIFFSLCAGPDMPRGSRHFLRETGNLFNVAVSRARAVLHVVGNRAWAAHCGIPHVERLACPKDCRPAPPPKTPWHPHESPYEKMLFKALEEAGLEPKPQYPVRFRRLDMALIRSGENGLKLDIEVDGDCHRNADGSRKLDDMWRDIELQAMGWKVARFWTYQLREDLPGSVAKIMKIWEQA
ncbi:AAA domain-containing protein [Desulfovibrio subterraneus]|uniref:AAA domain-containing protein n=1 Tax=Desulfovibrio subterraneus TaxID=2718620 RepID=UPI00196468F6|nr:AAA domain-containing protein [Desulfovibrio subterraneus]